MVFWLAGFPVVFGFLAASWLGSVPGFCRGLFAGASGFFPATLLLRLCSLAAPLDRGAVAGGAPAAVPASGRAGKEKKLRSHSIETL